MTEDISSPQELIRKSNSGMLKVTASTPSKSTTTVIGFLRSDSSPPQPRLQLEVNISPPSDGTDISRSGTTRPSTSRTASRYMTAPSTPSLFLPEETSL